MAYEAKIVLDSISEAGDRLTTMEVTFPRMVLAEFNTHRMFSRNSASSRAIPVEKQLARIKADPFIPVYWGKNQSGMQAAVELDEVGVKLAKMDWLVARDMMVSQVESLLDLGLHKQITNRLLEPFMWHTVIVTATDWSNFFALRANPDAQPEIRVIAEMMKKIYEESQPTRLKMGQWHLPYIQPDERDGVFEFTENARMISAARCARVSYLTHDGNRDLSADLTLYTRLVGGGHMPPLEHVATPAGFEQIMDSIGQEYVTEAETRKLRPYYGNFRGWKQLRKFIFNEHDFSLVGKE